MRKLFCLVLTALLCLSVNAQVRIGGDAEPHPAAVLDLNGSNATNNGKLGLALPRVALTSSTDKTSVPNPPIGMVVYNTSSVGSIYPGLYTWTGSAWETSQANPAPVSIISQPKAFSFYELGTETPKPLTFGVDGGLGIWSYQWYEITGSNLHVRIGQPVTEGTGATTASYTPTQVIKGTTRNANNTGFYRFYCVATNSIGGEQLTSDVAEIAVGCGAKNNLGEWITFMCFNLGADNESTIDKQIGYDIGSFSNSSNGLHTYIDGEENLWGDLFQWGRIADGHEKRQSDVLAFGIMTTSEIGDGNRCSSNDAYRPHQQIKKESSWHGKFISSALEHNNNWTPVVQSTADQLWRSTRFVQNDPCAHYTEEGTYQEFWHEGTDQTTNSAACIDAGTAWRTPTQAEWGEIYRGGAISGSPNMATANTWVWNNTNGRGYEIRPDGQTITLFLPASGYRHTSNGLLYRQGAYAHYWSANVTGTSSYSMYIANGSIIPANSLYRAYGVALRCIKNT